MKLAGGALRFLPTGEFQLTGRIISDGTPAATSAPPAAPTAAFGALRPVPPAGTHPQRARRCASAVRDALGLGASTSMTGTWTLEAQTLYMSILSEETTIRRWKRLRAERDGPRPVLLRAIAAAPAWASVPGATGVAVPPPPAAAAATVAAVPPPPAAAGDGAVSAAPVAMGDAAAADGTAPTPAGSAAPVAAIAATDIAATDDAVAAVPVAVGDAAASDGTAPTPAVSDDAAAADDAVAVAPVAVGDTAAADGNAPTPAGSDAPVAATAAPDAAADVAQTAAADAHTSALSGPSADASVPERVPEAESQLEYREID